MAAKMSADFSALFTTVSQTGNHKHGNLPTTYIIP
jgi:hypothetical protein